LSGTTSLHGSEARSRTLLGAVRTYKYISLYSHTQSPHI
jgi:hypothetical protein